jgi:prepilin-type N-terminal cleavage/methylation domain-containing protein
MVTRRAFTLIELLVVIAIIAVLMSILMPALSKAKEQAQSVADQSNQHQFALTWKFYTDDHDGFFPTRPDIQDWPQIMLSYMGGTDTRIWLCPAATKPFIEGARPPFAAWDDDVDIPGGGQEKIYGSYTVNLWIAITRDMQANRPVENFWQSPNVKGASYAPLLMDGNWSNSEPEPDDDPPPYDGYWWQPNANEMKRVCINRHNYEVNASFLDLSVKTVRLKELWTTKWHRQWPTDCSNIPPGSGWPEWMAHLPEPCQ